MGGELDRIGTAELRSALSWWIEAGVDIAVAEEPRNWLNPSPAVAFAESGSREARALPTQEPQTMPDTLDAFREWLGSASDLPFAAPGSRRALPLGSAKPPVMLMADMPAMDCDPDGGPLSGDSRALADRMLEAIGVDPAQAYVASLSCFHTLALPARGPELDACADLARRHISLVQPRRLLLLGEGPCRALIGKSLAAARGHVHKVEGVRTIATFQPSFLALHPLQKEAAWSDLLLLMEDE